MSLTGQKKVLTTWLEASQVESRMGQVWRLRNGDVTVVLTNWHKAGYWDAVIIDAPEGSTSLVSGLNVCASVRELDSGDAELVDVKKLFLDQLHLYGKGGPDLLEQMYGRGHLDESSCL